VSGLYRATYILTVAAFLIMYYGCGSTSSTGRYGNQTDDTEEEIDISSRRFSSGDLPDDDQVDISAVMEVYEKSGTNNDIASRGETNKEKMLMEIIRFLNTPYQYGGNSKQGIDCSAFTQTVFENTLSYNLNRSARDQYKQGKSIRSMEDLQFGDLIFFNTQTNVRPGHVGIYIGDNLFAHASTKKGVTVSSLTHTYYQSRFMGGRRIEPDGTF
jgi:cell wall-associated NlpC family hydrolase